MKNPNLLICKSLIQPLELALERLTKLRQQKVNTSEPIIREGLFVLSISAFENALLDSLRVLLNGIPQKLGQTHTISKESLIEDKGKKEFVDSTIHKVSYKSIQDIFTDINKYFGIDNLNISEDDIDIIVEFKASRNLLIHNNLEINSIYQSTAGRLKRTGINNKLEIEDQYLAKCLTVQSRVLSEMKLKIDSKYSDYTRIRALKQLWKYTFGEHFIFSFEEVWETSEETDSIFRYKSDTANINLLSSGEKTLFSLWLTNVIGDNVHQTELNFHRLDQSNLNRASFIIKNLEYFKSS